MGFSPLQPIALHDARIQQPVALRQTLHLHPLYSIRSYEGLLAILCVTTKPKDLSQQLMALICTEWRIQPTLGHITGWLGWGGVNVSPSHWKSCTPPSPPCLRAVFRCRGCFGVLGQELKEERDGMDWL